MDALLYPLPRWDLPWEPQPSFRCLSTKAPWSWAQLLLKVGGTGGFRLDGSISGGADAKARGVPLATGASSGSPSHASSGVAAGRLLCGWRALGRNGLIPAEAFYERERAQKTRGAANLLVAPSRLGRDGRCGPAHSLLGSARGPRLLAHRREVASWAPRLWLAPSSRHRFGVIATRPQSVAWCGEEICVDTVLPPIPDPSLGSARPESESCGSIALSMGRRGGESLLKRPETFGKGSVILSLTLSCLLSWRD